MGSLIHHPPAWAIGIGLCVIGYLTFEITKFIRDLALEELARRREEEENDQ